MKSSLFAGAFAALASLALAAPHEERNAPVCISHREANCFIQKFESILAKQNSSLGTPEQTANALLADSFTETSNSILQLEGLPLNGTGLSETSKASWINGVVHFAPPYGDITNKAIIVDCNKIVWYYRFGKIGNAQYPIQGFDYFIMTPTGNYPHTEGPFAWQVSQLFVEFDNISWGKDTGEVTCTAAAGGPPAGASN